MNQESKEDPERERVSFTDAYHIEKYVVPGAFMVALIFLFPRSLLGGGPLGTWDLGTVLIAALVVGHLIESLKVYQWGPTVRANFESFKGKIEGLLGGWGLPNDQLKKQTDKVLTIVFTVLPPSQRSEFSWNLVRWQKMSVMAVILLLGGIEWFVIAFLAYLQSRGFKPFRLDFALTFFEPDFAGRWSLYGEILIGVVLIVSARFVYLFGIDRQKRNNEAYFQLIRFHKKDILAELTEAEKIPPSGKGSE